MVKVNKFSLFSCPLLLIIFLCLVFITRCNITSFLDEISQFLLSLTGNPLVLVESRGKLLILCDHQTTSEDC